MTSKISARVGSATHLQVLIPCGGPIQLIGFRQRFAIVWKRSR